jgi:hypothetical protein
MSIQIAWDDDRHQIILVTVEGGFAWEELDAALSRTLGMMDTVNHKVHFIIDIRRAKINPGSALGQAQKAATPDTHRNEGMKLVVGANPIVKMLYNAYRKIVHSMGKEQEFLFAKSIEAARERIAQEQTSQA